MHMLILQCSLMFLIRVETEDKLNYREISTVYSSLIGNGLFPAALY